MNQSAAAALSLYFEETFVAAALKDVKPDTVQQYRKAVRRFVGWSGCDIRIHDIDEFLVERFYRGLIIDGVGMKTARAWSVYVRRVVRTGTGRCLKAAGHRPQEHKAVVIHGMSEDDLRAPNRSLLKFLEEQYIPRRMLGCKAGSINQHRWAINAFAKFLGRAPLLDDLSNAQMSKFMGWSLQVRNLKPVSVNDHRRSLLSLWRYARKRGLIREEPNDCDKLPEPRNLPIAWTIDEISRIIAAARLQTSPQIGMSFPAYVWWPAILLVAYDTGLRVSALMGIRRSDWRSDRNEITVLAETQKQAVAQTFRVSDQTSEAIRKMLNEPLQQPDEPPEFLFPFGIRRDAIHFHLRTILKRAGLYVKGMDTWHRMRKSTATHLTAAIGIEAASRQLGHTSVQMTKRYVDPRLTGHHDAASHLPRPE